MELNSISLNSFVKSEKHNSGFLNMNRPYLQAFFAAIILLSFQISKDRHLRLQGLHIIEYLNFLLFYSFSLVLYFF